MGGPLPIPGQVSPGPRVRLVLGSFGSGFGPFMYMYRWSHPASSPFFEGSRFLILVCFPVPCCPGVLVAPRSQVRLRPREAGSPFLIYVYIYIYIRVPGLAPLRSASDSVRFGLSFARFFDRGPGLAPLRSVSGSVLFGSSVNRFAEVGRPRFLVEKR